MAIVFRAPKPQDANSLYQINLAVQHSPWSVSAINDELEIRNPFSLVAVDSSGQPVGYIFIRGSHGSFELMSVAVSKANQGRGLGRELIKNAVEQIKTLSVAYDKVHLHLEVSTQNTNAIRLYRSLGFKEMRVRKGYYSDGSDAVDMSLKIT